MKVRFGPARGIEDHKPTLGIGLVLEAENADDDRVVKYIAELGTPVEISNIFTMTIDPRTGERADYSERITHESIRRVARSRPVTRELANIILRIPKDPDVVSGEVARAAATRIRESLRGLGNCLDSAARKKSVKSLRVILRAIDGFRRDILRDNNVRALRGEEE